MQHIIAELDRLSTAVGERESQIREAVVDEIKSTASAGTTPNGTPWPKTSTGEEPLKNAADHVKGTSKTIDGRVVVLVKVTGHYALHDLGRANGAPRRQILPDAMTPAIQEAIGREVDSAIRPA